MKRTAAAFFVSIGLSNICTASTGQLGESLGGGQESAGNVVTAMSAERAEPTIKMTSSPLPIDLAIEAAKLIVKSCAGYNVSVSIIDASGQPKLFYVPDGTPGSRANIGFRKANTALRFKSTSGAVGLKAKSDEKLALMLTTDSTLIGWAGGVLITVKNEIIGAIGVSGADSSDKDEVCALTGVKWMELRLTLDVK